MAGKSLSSYWAGESHRALSGATSVENRLAIALTPIRSIIRVIDDSTPPMSVDWAKVGKDDKGKPLSISFTDFRGARIAVNPLPVIEGKLSAGEQIDVCAGFAMHEASHAKHSRERYKHLVREEPDEIMSRRFGRPTTREVPAFEPMQIVGYLYNLVEDVRIEAATSRNWRGFAPYFANLLDWMWMGSIKDKIVEDGGIAYGPAVTDKIRFVFMACRFPDRLDPIIAGKPDLVTEAEWWKAWQADYLSDAADTPTTISRALDHLGEDPATRKELDEMSEAEQRERAAGEKLRAQIERLMREGIKGVPGVCITDEGEVRPLTAKEAEVVDQLVKEGLTPVTPIIPHRGSERPEMRVRKPSETGESRRAYIGRPDAATEALRAALVFRSERPRYEIKLQRQGVLDDEELYRFGLGDDRLFTEKVIESSPDTLLGLLVDLSGSMLSGHGEDEYRSKIDTAQRLAQLFLWATHDMEGVTTAVWGHTGDSEYGHGSDIFRIWEPGDPLRRVGLITSLDHGNNYDGYAIAWCADRMRGEPQPQKVLLVLSDGYPAGSGYGGREAEHHMRQVTTWARGQGVETIQIAIDASLRPADQARMFGPGNWIPYTNERQLPRDLTRILARFAK